MKAVWFSRVLLVEVKRLGLGQIIMGSGGHEYLVAVGQVDRGLCIYVLRYADELRDAEKYFGDLPDGPAPAQLVDMAVQLIEENTSPFKAEAYRNSYEVALLDLVGKKSEGKKVVAKEQKEERPGTRNVLDLMDALRKSMKSDRATEKTERTGEKKKARKSRGVSSHAMARDRAFTPALRGTNCRPGTSSGVSKG